MTEDEAKHTTVAVGNLVTFTRDDIEHVGKVVGWYDSWLNGRTYIVEVEAEMTPMSSDGRWHVSALAARAANAKATADGQ